MATTPRVPSELVKGFTLQIDQDNGTPAAAIGVPSALARLAGAPIRTKKSFQIDPVLQELIRLYHAKNQGCQFCQNLRQAVAVQNGFREDMVDRLANFEASDFPENVKAVLRLTSAFGTNPALITDEMWKDASRYFTDQELIDIILWSMHATAIKVAITLGLDPGKEASSRMLFPSEIADESAEYVEALAELRAKGLVVTAEEIEARPELVEQVRELRARGVLSAAIKP
jgi:alkylhydroperoxidase family enzyme